MTKQHLKPAKANQCRGFDALSAHTTIVFLRYIFLAYQCRTEPDHRTFGDLFYACRDEVTDISFFVALCRIFTPAFDRLKQLAPFCEMTAAAFFNYGCLVKTAIKAFFAQTPALTAYKCNLGLFYSASHMAAL